MAESDDHARAIAREEHAATLTRHPSAVVARWTYGAWAPIDDQSPTAPSRSAPPTDPPTTSKTDSTDSYGVDSGGDHLGPVLNEGNAPHCRFGELHESLEQVRRALRQLARAQTAHRAEQARRLELGFVSGEVPAELVELATDRDDAMEFAILAAKRAAAAHTYLTGRGLSLPQFREKERVWALRDLLEHWEEWRVAERESFLKDNRWLLTKRAGKKWDAASHGRPPLAGHSATTGPPPGPMADAEGRITEWSETDINDLTQDLSRLGEAIAVEEVRAFEWELPTEQTIISLLGPTEWEHIKTRAGLRGRRGRDGQTRWERTTVLAAACTVDEHQHHRPDAPHRPTS